MPTPSIPSAAIAVNRPRVSGPVVVSVPHAGRIYPPEILAAARVERSQLERLEDGWCDLLATGATGAGATVVLVLWARAAADLHRAGGQLGPGERVMAITAQFSSPGHKEREETGTEPCKAEG